MPVSGKYDFRGIKKLGAANLRRLLALSPATSWMLAFGPFIDVPLEMLSNFLANKGLVLLNIGANYGSGLIDQREFDEAMKNALAEIEIKGGRDKLTPAEKKAIDDEVIKKARRLIVIARGS